MEGRQSSDRRQPGGRPFEQGKERAAVAYEEYDGDTLERVWQSLFKVYNQTLRKLGDNDFSVDHTGVGKRQREGTLERVVKYDVDAFKTAWDYLADEEEEVGGGQKRPFLA